MYLWACTLLAASLFCDGSIKDKGKVTLLLEVSDYNSRVFLMRQVSHYSACDSCEGGLTSLLQC